MNEAVPESACTFLPQGALIQEFSVAGHNLVLSLPTTGHYTTHNQAYFGETIGRTTNRIRAGQIPNLNGKTYQLATNDGPRLNSLHGGNEGWGKKIWDGPKKVNRKSREGLQFTYLSKDGDEGYPGAVEAKVWYFAGMEHGLRGREDTVLEVEYEVQFVGDECEETVVGVTNHSYFTVNPDAPNIANTRVKLGTDHYQELDADQIPTGKIIAHPSVPNSDTEFTFTSTAPSFDDCFVLPSRTDPSEYSSIASSTPLDTRPLPLRKLCSLSHPETGLNLEIESTEPAFQFYTGEGIDVEELEKADKTKQLAMGARKGIAIEPSRRASTSRIAALDSFAFLDESEAAVQRRSNVVFHNHFISLWKVVLTDITMPKEHKKRGRREEKKRKHEDEPDGKASKRRKSQDAEEDVEIIVDNEGPGHFEDNAADLRLGQIPFYGMLDDEEQEYFKRADSMLELNQFANQEERELFLANVYKEANGKELKIANSQSCSRLLERLIVMSKPVQMKALFQRFSGHFLHLIQHRFASHCCETLFTKAAPVVTEELVAPLEAQQEGDSGEAYISMENHFLHTLNELEGNLGYLLTDQFASHTLRVLLLVLSGRSITDANTKSLVKSKKSEDIGTTTATRGSNSAKQELRTVPSTFNDALSNLVTGLTAGLETTYLRALATHPTGNPVLQLLLEIGVFQTGKTQAKDPSSLLRKLIPDNPPEEGSDSTAFINGLLYDPVGSRLLETIIESAPGHTFKALYKSLFRERLGTLAKNDVACFPVIKILERLSKEKLELAIEQLCPKISTLIQRSRTSVIKTMIERCRIREVDTEPITAALQEAYGEEPSDAVLKMLGMSVAIDSGMAEERRKQLEDQDVSKVHGSLLAQSMLETPGPMREMILKGLIAMDALTLVRLAKDRSATHVLQLSLTCSNHDHTSRFRRTIIQRLAPHGIDLALDTAASHVVDAIYDASEDLRYPREQFAVELSRGESLLRQFPSGKAVWRNWQMDVYKRRRYVWIHGEEAEEPANTIRTKKGHKIEAAKAKREMKPKTPIELARERHATGQPPPHKAKPRTPMEHASHRHAAGLSPSRKAATHTVVSNHNGVGTSALSV